MFTCYKYCLWHTGHNWACEGRRCCLHCQIVEAIFLRGPMRLKLRIHRSIVGRDTEQYKHYPVRRHKLYFDYTESPIHQLPTMYAEIFLYAFELYSEFITLEGFLASPCYCKIEIQVEKEIESQYQNWYLISGKCNCSMHGLPSLWLIHVSSLETFASLLSAYWVCLVHPSICQHARNKLRTMQDLRFSQQWLWRVLSSGI
jgi:hypothetical protein